MQREELEKMSPELGAYLGIFIMVSAKPPKYTYLNPFIF